MAKKIYLIAGVILQLLIFFVVRAGLASAAQANISRSYNATSAISNGELVSLVSKQGNQATLANSTNSSRLLGVAIASSQSLIAINSSNSTLQVATTGTVNVLTSTVDGNIKIGDQIAVSPFSGIGVKASTGNVTIGIAESALTPSSTTSQLEVKNKQGNNIPVKIGSVKVGINIGKDLQGLPININQVQKIVKDFTGKTVSTFRIVCSFVIAILALAAMVALIHSSIYASIVAIGRNPLAENTIKRTLVAITVLTVLIFGLAAVSIYFLLK
jgi:hypothetical protein